MLKVLIRSVTGTWDDVLYMIPVHCMFTIAVVPINQFYINNVQREITLTEKLGFKSTLKTVLLKIAVTSKQCTLMIL